MSNELDTTPMQNDGSYDDAVAAMPDLLADDPVDFDHATGRPVPPPPRDVSGKFAAKEPVKAAEPKAPNDVKAAAEAPTPEAVADETDDDYIEMPSDDEGTAPVKYKLAEVVEGWQKSKTLEAELTKARETVATPLPHEVEQHVVALQKERAGVVAAMKQWQDINRPLEPNLELTNPASPNYNPELFHSQLQNYQRQLAQHAEVSKRIEAAEAQTKTEQEAIRSSKIARETAELRKFWPEVVTDESVRETTAKALFDHYKIDNALLDSDLTLDHRFYALAKDALAFRAMQGKQADAVKAVKAKPRLIQGQARQAPSNPDKARQNDAYSRLSQSGSLEDAADALEGFL
jgi:hypothetical protein